LRDGGEYILVHEVVAPLGQFPEPRFHGEVQ
jgi:hypothetical protein